MCCALSFSLVCFCQCVPDIYVMRLISKGVCTLLYTHFLLLVYNYKQLCTMCHGQQLCKCKLKHHANPIKSKEDGHGTAFTYHRNLQFLSNTHILA